MLADEASSASCEAAVQQPLKQQAETNNQLNTRLSILLEQGHSAKQLNDIKNLQQQLGKQVTPPAQPPVFKKSSKKDALIYVFRQNRKTTPDGKMILGETEWIYVEEANATFMSRVIPVLPPPLSARRTSPYLSVKVAAGLNS